MRRSSMAVSTGEVMRGSTMISALTSMVSRSLREVPRRLPESGLRTTISVIACSPRAMGLSRMTVSVRLMRCSWMCGGGGLCEEQLRT
ncbi:hypothetical protein D3C80_2041310 [compost metagenome]